jgi:LPXTG-motif cell wall-anchored protein
LSAASPTITILPVGGLPVTGGNIAPVFIGIGILAMAFLGVRFTNRVRRFRNVKRRS